MRKVHRGHCIVEALEASQLDSMADELTEAAGSSVGVLYVVVDLLAAFETAAFKTWAKGGLMPHARQGASEVWTFAVVGSKLDGTGFENVQIGHTQVASLLGVVACVGK